MQKILSVVGRVCILSNSEYPVLFTESKIVAQFLSELGIVELSLTYFKFSLFDLHPK